MKYWREKFVRTYTYIFLSSRYFLEEWTKTLWIFRRQIDILLKEKVFRSENNSWYKFKPSHDSCSLLFSSLSIIENAKKKKKKLIRKNPQGRVLIIETLNSSGNECILRTAMSYIYNNFNIWNAFILIFFLLLSFH